MWLLCQPLVSAGRAGRKRTEDTYVKLILNASVRASNQTSLLYLPPPPPHPRQPGKKCLHIYREEPANFTLSGCISRKAYQPKYCGVCVPSDQRCCIPYKSKTIQVEFQCPSGAVFTWPLMWIQACFCNLSCRNPNDIFAELESHYGYPGVAN